MRRTLTSMAFLVAVTGLALCTSSGCRVGSNGGAGGASKGSGSCNEAGLRTAATERGPALAVLGYCSGLPKPVERLITYAYAEIAPDKRQQALGKSLDHLLKQLWPAWEKVCPGLTKHSSELCLYPPGKANKTCSIESIDQLRRRANELTKRCALHKHPLFSEAEAASLRLPHEGLLAISLYDWMTTSAGVSKKVAGDVVKAMVGVIAAVGCDAPYSARCLTSLQNARNFRDSPLSVSQDPSLRLPGSRANFLPEDSITVTITKTQIVVDNKKVVPIECATASDAQCTQANLEAADNRFHVDKAYKEDGNANSFLIEPLYKKLDEMVKMGKEDAKVLHRKFNGVVTLIVDHRIPYRVIAEAVHSAGMAGLSDLRFVVLNPSDIHSALKIVAVQLPRMVSNPLKKAVPPPLNLTVLVTSAGLELIVGTPHRKALNKLLATIPRGKDGQQAYHLLYNRLRKISAAFPDERTLNVGAEMAIAWQELLGAMDAGMTLLDANSYDSADLYRKAKRPTTESNRRAAFPAVVFVVAE